MLKASVIALAIGIGAGVDLAETATSPATSQSANPSTYAPAQMLKMLPEHASAVSNLYDQNVYDPAEAKIGEIKDMLLDKTGRVSAVIMSVGGFLGMNEKDVALPFDSINVTRRNNKAWLVVNATKDELKSAPGFRYDRQQGTWSMAQY